MSDSDILLQDIADEELRAELKMVLDGANIEPVQEIMEDVLNESRGSSGISEEDREAIAKEASRRMELFFKGTVLVGYIDLRRQIKAVQREIAALRKDQDKFEKKVATKDDLEEVRKKLDARIQSGLRGKSGSDRRQEMDTFYNTVDQTAADVKSIMQALKIPAKS